MLRPLLLQLGNLLLQVRDAGRELLLLRFLLISRIENGSLRAIYSIVRPREFPHTLIPVWGCPNLNRGPGLPKPEGWTNRADRGRASGLKLPHSPHPAGAVRGWL